MYKCVIVWQRFCDLARLRVEHCLCVCSSVRNLVRLFCLYVCLALFPKTIVRPTTRGVPKAYAFLVISIPLCQTSCSLRTVHYKGLETDTCQDKWILYRHLYAK